MSLSARTSRLTAFVFGLVLPEFVVRGLEFISDATLITTCYTGPQTHLAVTQASITLIRRLLTGNALEDICTSSEQ